MALERNKFCSDLFTRDTLMERLQPILPIRVYQVAVTILLGVICMVSRHFRVWNDPSTTLHFCRILIFPVGCDGDGIQYCTRKYEMCVDSTGRYYFVPHGTPLPFVDVHGVRTERVERMHAAAPTEPVVTAEVVSLEVGVWSGEGFLTLTYFLSKISNYNLKKEVECFVLENIRLQYLQMLVKFFGLSILLNSLLSPTYLFDGRSLGDGAALATMTFIPEFIWVIIWCGLAIMALYQLMRANRKRSL